MTTTPEPRTWNRRLKAVTVVLALGWAVGQREAPEVALRVLGVSDDEIKQVVEYLTLVESMDTAAACAYLFPEKEEP